MKFLKSKAAALLTDIVCCTLLGASVLTILLPYTGLEADYGGCLLVMAVDLGLIFLFTRKWWILPALAVLAVGTTLLITTALGTSTELFTYIGGFIRWCAQSFPKASVYSTTAGIMVVLSIMALPAAALTYLFFRRLFFFPALPPIALVLLLWTYLAGLKAFWEVFAMLLAVIFISIAKMNSNRINKSLPEQDRISGALPVITSIVLVPIMMFFAFSLSPKKDGEWQVRALYNAVEDLGDYFGWGEGRGPVQGTFGIEKTGFSPLEQRLGGNVTLDNTEVLRVTTDSPACLKGAVYNTYDGERWYDTGGLDRYRLNSILWGKKRGEVFCENKPDGGSDAKELFEKITRPAEFDVRYSLGGRSLFFAGQFKSLDSKYLDLSDVFFNRQAELFTSQRQRSMKYTLSSVVIDRQAPGFDDNMLALEKLMESAEDDGFESICAEYLQLPESLPVSVRETAQQITQGCGSAYLKAKALEGWLSQNCKYTLSPGRPPEGADFVEHFLEKREGYCVYFASAMTVMSRSIGLPARFAAGYALKRDPASNAHDAYVATNAMAHAWTEVYFKGIGWITFDATGWNFNETAVVQQHEYTGTPAPAPTPAPTPVIVTDDDQQATGGDMSSEIKVLLTILICLVAALVLFMIIRFIVLLAGASGYYRRLCRKYDTVGERVSACYARIVRQAAFLGVKQQTDDTITSFTRRADEYLRSDEMSAVCGSVIRMRFGLVEPGDNELEALCLFSAALEKRLRRDLGISGYLWRRILLGR